jgi:hypothetical protein
MYSNEFIWAFKDCYDSHYAQFHLVKWLVHERLQEVMKAVNYELSSSGVAVPDDASCYHPAFQSRFECDHGRPINASDSLTRIDEKTVKDRIVKLKAGA